MGTIISSRMQANGKVILEVSLDYEEAIQLQGRMDNIHLFSDSAPGVPANISQRGRNESTKYFLIPKQLRSNLHFDKEVKCHKIEGKGKVIFIYTYDRIKG